MSIVLAKFLKETDFLKKEIKNGKLQKVVTC